MNRRLVICSGISIGLHLLLLFTTASSPNGKERTNSKPPDQGQVNVATRLKSDSSEIDYERRLMDVRKNQINKLTKGELVKCDLLKGDKPYVGIGIRYSPTVNGYIIVDAPAEFPAYQAGLRVGDTYSSVTIANGYADVHVDSPKEKTYKIRTKTICFE